MSAACVSQNMARHLQAIGWLLVSLLTQHRTMCGILAQHTGRGILLDPPIQFGRHHTYDTKYPA